MQAPLKTRRVRRRARTPSNLGILFLDGLGDLVLEFLAGLFELTHALAESAGKFREFLRSKEEQNGEENQKDLLRTKAGKGDKVGQRIHLSESLGCGLEVVKGKFRKGLSRF